MTIATTSPGPGIDAARRAGPPPAAAGSGASADRRTLRSRAIGAAFSLFSSMRIVAYLPMLWAIAMSSDSSQHSLLTWLLWLGSNLSTALWLHDRGSGVRGAVLVSLSNAVMCALAVALILALRA